MVVSSTRVKEYRFGTTLAAGSNIAIQYTDHSINGEILKVEVSTELTGSVFVFVSGTNESILTISDVSGTNPIIAYPRTQITDNTNATIANSSGNIWAERIVNEPLAWAGSGFTSGTSNEVNFVRIFYR